MSDIAANYAGKAWNGNESAVLLHDMSSTALGAAFVNATTANAPDCDDGGQYTRGHLGAQVYKYIRFSSFSIGNGSMNKGFFVLKITG